MARLDPLRKLASGTSKALQGTAAMGVNAASEWASLLRGLPGDDLDEWNTDYIRRTLPLMRAFFHTFFRGEVHGLDRIPHGPPLLVGNHSGGTMIADTFVFATAFYERFGPERRFHQLAHD